MDELSNLSLDEQLHAADVESLEHRIMRLALEQTRSQNGAIFLWDEAAEGLVLDFHVVAGVIVNLPGVVIRRRHDGRPNGIAMWVFDQEQPYHCGDTAQDPLYARYFLEVRSIVAAPIRYQGRAIGVISVSDPETDAFSDADVDALVRLADASAKFLRRAQLSRAHGAHEGRPFLIKGLSPAWLEVERRVEQVSRTDAPVLIHGESGTGKELVAHAIHFNSKRSDRPFVIVNCAAIPEAMLESLLFGHVKGAFTGASFDKIGEFQKANGGTLFLDEVGELPMTLQPKVLRAVEQGDVQPLGSNNPPEHVDVRLICATNRDLAAMAREGQYRDDLYYRLSVMTVTLPALRTYKDNLEVLVHVFLRQARERHHKSTHRVAPDALAALYAYDYPGNVRELKNAIEHAVIMARGDEVTLADLPPAISESKRGKPPARTPKRQTLRELRETWLAPLERRYLTELLEECDGNVREAADRAGINAVTMYRLLKKRGLKLARSVQKERKVTV